jgi:transposase-like protein
MLDLRQSLINSTLHRVLKRLHYPLEVMLTCVRWYVAYPLSLRHVEEMMQERGVYVDHVTIHRWMIKMLPVLAAVFRRRKRAVNSSWRLDESVSRTQAKACGAVLKMGVGLPKSACRSRLQTARC